MKTNHLAAVAIAVAVAVIAFYGFMGSNAKKACYDQGFTDYEIVGTTIYCKRRNPTTYLPEIQKLKEES